MRVWNFGPNVSCFESSGSTTKSQFTGMDQTKRSPLPHVGTKLADRHHGVSQAGRSRDGPRASNFIHPRVATLDDELIGVATSPSPGKRR